MTCKSEQTMLAWGARLTRGGDVDFATRVGPKVQTVLGLSMTSTSVGWVLLDSHGPEAATLDHDSFDVQSTTEGAEQDTSAHEAAARGAQAIATASGHKVGSVQLTWTEGVEAAATAFLKSLADMGFDNVHAIPLSKAAEAWGIDVGSETEHTRTGLCILEPDEAMMMVVATGARPVRTAITDTRATAADLVEWLRTVFRKDGWRPESLYLVGALADLDEVTQPIAEALPIPVSDSGDTQLALARGAALATVGRLDAGDAPSTEPRERPWRMSRPKKTIIPVAETIAMATVWPVDTDSPAAEPPRSDEPRSDRPWLVSHARKLTISAAAAAVFGAALSLTASSALNVENTSTQAGEPAAERAPFTSASPYPVLTPISAAPAAGAHPLAAPPARPETIAVPQHSASASPPATV